MIKGITIFTPTYNRGYILPQLYNSLCKQTNSSFEWLVVDDGSTDNTKELFDLWISEKKINIRYMYQKNAGKSQAHNKGVLCAQYELFSCVDSDDFITENAVDIVLDTYEKNTECIGYVFGRRTPEGKIITKWPRGLTKGRLREAYQNYGMSGDTMLVYRTEIINKYHFPHFEGEKFVPEAYLYDQIDQEGDMVFTNKNIYICQYLQDGYTASMKKVIHDNPRGYEAYIIQRLKMDTEVMHKVSDVSRYIAVKILIDKRKVLKDALYPKLTFWLYPFGYLLYIKNYKKYNEWRK